MEEMDEARVRSGKSVCAFCLFLLLGGGEGEGDEGPGAEGDLIAGVLIAGVLIDAASASSAAHTWSSCQRYSTSRRHRPHPQQSAISSAATSTTGSSGLSAPEPLLTADRKSF
jgi:hypothetical protein